MLSDSFGVSPSGPRARRRRAPRAAPRLGHPVTPVHALTGVAKFKKNAPSDSFSKTRVFERDGPNRKFRKKNGLNVSQNSFLISASQKGYGRPSLERDIHAEEKSAKRSYGLAQQTTTPRRTEGRTSNFSAATRRGRIVERHVARLRASFDH
jgi:hypothetical protein